MRPRLCGVGIDVVEIARAKKFISRHRDKLQTFFLPHEHRTFKKSRQKVKAFALMFAAKEAASKALGITVLHPRQFQEFSVHIKNGLRVRCAKKKAVLRMGAFESDKILGVVAFALKT